MSPDLLKTLAARRPLPVPLIRLAVAGLVDESVPDEEKAAFLEALAAKGETPEEVAGFVKEMLALAVDPGLERTGLPGPTIDVCGTGGDRMGFFNVSTAVMFVAAGAGACVIKHGNRGITSRCGGADVLEALGVRIDLSPQDFRDMVRRSGAGFLFAPHYHPAFKAVAPARKLLAERGVATIFNMLGPLLNPARPEFQLTGVFHPRLLDIYPAVFVDLGRRKTWTVHGATPSGPLDEVSTMGITRVAHTRGATREHSLIDARDFGFDIADPGVLRGADAGANAAIITAILDGSDRGPRRDIVVLNAAAALCAADLAGSLGEGIFLAQTSVDSGEAHSRLQRMRG